MSSKRGPLSLSEISFYVTRAAVGVGVPWGLAEDLARTAVYIARGGVDPSPLIVDALSRLDSQTSQSQLVFEDHGDSTELTTEGSGMLSVIFAAPAARDWMIEQHNSGKCDLSVTQLDVPDLAVSIVRALTPGTRRWSVGKSADDSIKVSLSKEQGADVSNITGHSGGALVDSSAWCIIQTYFAKCLVASTTESRLGGAGAGVNDND